MTRLTGDTDGEQTDGDTEADPTAEKGKLTDGGVANTGSTSGKQQATPAEDTSADQEVTEQDADTAAPESLSLDVIFEIAKNERRRRVLQYLSEHEGPVPIGNLAEHIAAQENDKEIRALTSSERKRVYVGLYQCHLPKMDGAGVVNFDRTDGVTLGPAAPQVMECLGTDDHRWRWNRYYLAVSLLGAGVLGAAAVVGAGTAGALAGVGVTVVLFLMAAVHTYVVE